MIAKLAYAFRGAAVWLNKFERYTTEEQRIIAEDKAVEVLTFTDGEKDIIPLKPSLIVERKELAAQVFDKDGIRDLSEQAAYIEGEKRKAALARALPSSVGAMKLDRVAKTGKCGGHLFTLADFKAIVRELEK